MENPQNFQHYKTMYLWLSHPRYIHCDDHFFILILFDQIYHGSSPLIQINTMSTEKTFACHKMIRGNDAQWMLQHNIKAKTHPIPSDQKEMWIKMKLIGEATEVSTAATHIKSLSELVDVQEAINALLHTWSISTETFEKMCQEKRALRGSYQDGVLLTHVTMNEDNPHYSHYSAHPEKFTPVADPV